MSASITPDQLKQTCARGESIELIDVRTPAEFRELHLQIARNVPLDRLDPAALRSRTW
jgi:rhodanese-related sulfurtransferase